jgi:hypothetical protein
VTADLFAPVGVLLVDDNPPLLSAAQELGAKLSALAEKVTT